MNSVIIVFLFIASFFSGVVVRQQTLPRQYDCPSIKNNNPSHPSDSGLPKRDRTGTETRVELDNEYDTERDLFCTQPGQQPIPVQGS